MKPQFITENVVRRSVSAMPQALRVSSEEVIPPGRRDRGHSVLRATYGSSLAVELRGMQVAHPHLSRGAIRSSDGRTRRTRQIAAPTALSLRESSMAGQEEVARIMRKNHRGPLARHAEHET